MNPIARLIELQLPQTIRIGTGAAGEVGKWAQAAGFQRTLVVTTPPIRHLVPLLGLPGSVTICADIASEPELSHMRRLLDLADSVAPNLIVGLGGGSVLDAAKIAAALVGSGRAITDVVGSDRVTSRKCALAQVPTTAGTGSEVGMRALVTDSATSAKLMIQSRYLLADLVAVDPALMLSLPAAITASTGVDALAHCVEAYTNRLSHPVIDLYAMEGIRLIGRWLPRAVRDGADVDARTALAIASLYGGICLGPVNTAAGHAVAYPLGTRHRVAHGVANAIIFPHVLEFNAEAVPEKTADVVEALGYPRSAIPAAVFASAYDFCRNLGIEMRISAAGVPAADFSAMASAAHGIRRLMDNNPRPMEVKDIVAIYEAADQAYNTAHLKDRIGTA